MPPNHLATEAAITAYAQLMMADKQRQDMLRLSSGSNPTGKHNNSASPLPPGMLPPFPGMPPMPPHHYLPMMSHFNPNGMPATPPFNQSLPIPNLPPPPSSKSPNTMMAMHHQQAKLMQALPQNMNESDFIRMISAQMQSSSKPTATDRVSTPPSTTSSPKPRSPKRPDSAAQTVNNNLFLQHLFENINRKGVDTSPVSEGKRKNEEASTDSEASTSKQKLQKTKHSYSIESLSNKSEDTDRNQNEENLTSTDDNDKLGIEETDQHNCEEIVKESVDVEENKDESSCHSVKNDDEDKSTDEIEKDPEQVNEATEVEEETKESEAKDSKPQDEENRANHIAEKIEENDDVIKASEVEEPEPETLNIETEKTEEDKGEGECDKGDKNLDLQEVEKSEDMDGFESVSSDNEEVKQSTDDTAV